MGTAKATPPREITLVYTLVAGTHTFFSREVPGLAVSGVDLEDAFNSALGGLSHHVSKIWGVNALYEPEMTCVEFAARVSEPMGAKLGVPLKGRLHDDHVTV